MRRPIDRLSSNSNMSGALRQPASSPDHQQQLHGNANGDQNDDYVVDSHIVELSEIIDREIRNNTWKSNSSKAETIFRVTKPNNEKLPHHSAASGNKMSTYQPAFLSIGPYHFNASEEMRRNEQGKLSLLNESIPQDDTQKFLMNSIRTKKAGKYGRFRRATEYYEAGVTFRRWRSEAAARSSSQRRRPALDVAFNNGVLSIALQDINENTGYILRNVLAYEQKYNRTATSPATSYVTAYVVFMSQLLGGVLEHLLGDDAEVCALFRGLAFDPGSEHYLSPVEVALHDHCRHRRYRWRAWIVRHRFGNPWLVAAWLFGGSAVLCTIIQTVFTVLSYVQQPH